jgi:hypothetical protein
MAASSHAGRARRSASERICTALRDCAEVSRETSLALRGDPAPAATPAAARGGLSHSQVPRPSVAPQQLRQLGKVRRHAPRLVLDEPPGASDTLVG